MHRKPAMSSTFYLLCAIGRPWPYLCAIFDTNAKFIPFHCFFSEQRRTTCGVFVAVSADFDWCFTWNAHFSSNILYQSRRPLQLINIVGGTHFTVRVKRLLTALVLGLTVCCVLWFHNITARLLCGCVLLFFLRTEMHGFECCLVHHEKNECWCLAPVFAGLERNPVYRLL